MSSLWGPFEPYDVRKAKLDALLAGVKVDLTLTSEHLRAAMKQADERVKAFRAAPQSACTCPRCYVLD